MYKTHNPLVIPVVRSEMDSSKRRRIGPGDDVTDAEVDEFYAILRRIRLSAKPCRPVQSPPTTWNPSFALEDFEVRKDERDTKRKEDAAVRSHPDAMEVQSGDRAPAVRRPLDLNEEPEPEAVMGPITG